MKVILGVLFFANLGVINGLLPPNIKVCRRNDPNISECIVQNTIKLIPRLASGDLGGGYIVPPLEPFYIKEVQFGEEKGLKVHIRDLNIIGASKFTAEKFRANAVDIKFDGIIRLPLIDIHGKYNMFINFLGSNLKSDGDFYSQFKDAKIKFSVRGQKYLKNGENFIKFDPIIIKFSRGTVTQLKISNLFGGNKVLGEIVQALLLNNPDYLVNSITPSIESTLTRHFTGIANKVVEYASYNELFPL